MVGELQDVVRLPEVDKSIKTSQDSEVANAHLEVGPKVATCLGVSPGELSVELFPESDARHQIHRRITDARILEVDNSGDNGRGLVDQCIPAGKISMNQRRTVCLHSVVNPQVLDPPFHVLVFRRSECESGQPCGTVPQ